MHVLDFYHLLIRIKPTSLISPHRKHILRSAEDSRYFVICWSRHVFLFNITVNLWKHLRLVLPTFFDIFVHVFLGTINWSLSPIILIIVIQLTPTYPLGAVTWRHIKVPIKLPTSQCVIHWVVIPIHSF